MPSALLGCSCTPTLELGRGLATEGAIHVALRIVHDPGCSLRTLPEDAAVLEMRRPG